MQTQLQMQMQNGIRKRMMVSRKGKGFGSSHFGLLPTQPSMASWATGQVLLKGSREHIRFLWKALGVEWPVAKELSEIKQDPGSCEAACPDCGSPWPAARLAESVRRLTSIHSVTYCHRSPEGCRYRAPLCGGQWQVARAFNGGI